MDWIALFKFNDHLFVLMDISVLLHASYRWPDMRTGVILNISFTVYIVAYLLVYIYIYIYICVCTGLVYTCTCKHELLINAIFSSTSWNQ